MFRKSSVTVWFLVAVVSLLTAVRLPLAINRCLWFDEAVSWRVTQMSWPELASRLPADVNPPLFYVLLKGLVSLFGDGEWALRSLSLLSLCALLVAAFRLGLERDREMAATLSRGQVTSAARPRHITAWTACLFLAASPIVWYYSVEARMYALGLGLALWSTWLVLRLAKCDGRPWRLWATYGFLGTCLAYVHSVGPLFVAAQAVFFATDLLFSIHKEERRKLRSRAAAGLAIYAAVALAWAPWSLIAVRQAARVSADYWTETLENQPMLTTDPWISLVYKGLFFGDQNDLPRNVGVALLVLSAAIPGGLAWRSSRTERCLLIMIVVPVLLLVAISCMLNRSLLVYRLFFISWGFFWVGVAMTLAKVADRLVRSLVLAIVFGNLFFASLLLQSRLLRAADRDMRAIADRIAENRRLGDVVLTGNAEEHLVLAYYARGRFPISLVHVPGRMRYYYAAWALQPEELLPQAEVRSLRANRAWCVDGVNHAIDGALPWRWRMASQDYEPQSLYWRGVLRCTSWEPVPDGPH